MTALFFQHLALFAYFLATAAFLVYAARRNDHAARGGNYLIITGFCFQTLSLALRTFSAGQLPVLGLAGAFCFFGWA
ncbi:MAG: hypothetical protein AB1896_23240, partial [Thermodesulfobacteriota bacterium]